MINTISSRILITKWSINRPVARVFEEGVLKLSVHKRGKFFGMTTPIFL